MDFRVDGKVAIVTGAAGGIGQVYARTLADAGAQVVIADLDATGAKRVADEMSRDGYNALDVGVDITSVDETKELARAATERFGGVDILLNNAALMKEIPMQPLSQFPLEWWNRVLAVNVTGALLCSQAVIPSMKERGGGRIINQASGGAFRPGTVYSISKYALVHLTASLASELGSSNINVNAIAPGWTTTEAGYQSASGEIREMILAGIPGYRKEAPPEDLCGALLLLASPAGQWITGQTISVDAGWVMRL